MRNFTRSTMIAGFVSILAAGTAMAQPQAITVAISPDFAKDAAKLGDREVQLQIEDMTRTIERTLVRRDELTGAVIDLTITDLKPNRPTLAQMSERPGLDPMRSVSIGGAAIEGTVTLADGTVQPVKFRYFTPNLRDAVGTGTWTDAHRAYNRLASNLANGRYVSR